MRIYTAHALILISAYLYLVRIFKLIPITQLDIDIICDRLLARAHDANDRQDIVRTITRLDIDMRRVATSKAPRATVQSNRLAEQKCGKL